MHHLGADALRYGQTISAASNFWGDVDVAVFPPATLLMLLGRILTGTRVRLGGQDCHHEREGAFTSAISAPMLADTGASMVLVGHSERRRLFGDGDDVVAKKLAAALAAELTPVLCVGETEEERDAGQTHDVLARQLRTALADVPIADAAVLVIAYEPVWAIGTGRTATPDLAQEAHAHVRSLFRERYGVLAADDLRILYGGSVKPDNFAALLAEEDIDGGLVGGASLQAESFLELVEHASQAHPLDGG
jgi:triosephosphate isomerase